MKTINDLDSVFDALVYPVGKVIPPYPRRKCTGCKGGIVAVRIIGETIRDECDVCKRVHSVTHLLGK